MMVSGQRYAFVADQRFISIMLMVVFALGMVTLIGLFVAVFLVCLFLLNLALNAVAEVAVQLHALYVGGDSFVRLVMWLIPLILLCKYGPAVGRWFRGRRAFVRA